MTARVLDPALFHLQSWHAAPEDALSTGLPPILSGSRCDRDGTVVFPYQASCPRCSSTAVAEMALPGQGALWSWTVQYFAPKSPYRGPVGADFVPYPLGYVDLGDVIVESRLQIEDVAALRIGMPMTLTWLRIWTEDDGDDVLSYAFTPIETAITRDPQARR